jgi:hypothetical protein
VGWVDGSIKTRLQRRRPHHRNSIEGIRQWKEVVVGEWKIAFDYRTKLGVEQMKEIVADLLEILLDHGDVLFTQLTEEHDGR